MDTFILINFSYSQDCPHEPLFGSDRLLKYILPPLDGAPYDDGGRQVTQDIRLKLNTSGNKKLFVLEYQTSNFICVLRSRRRLFMIIATLVPQLYRNVLQLNCNIKSASINPSVCISWTDMKLIHGCIELKFDKYFISVNWASLGRYSYVLVQPTWRRRTNGNFCQITSKTQST